MWPQGSAMTSWGYGQRNDHQEKENQSGEEEGGDGVRPASSRTGQRNNVGVLSMSDQEGEGSVWMQGSTRLCCARKRVTAIF